MLCGLCKGKEEKELIILENELATSFIPFAPLSKGHVLILPKRHALYEDLTKEEHLSIVEISCKLKDRLKVLMPNQQPLLFSVTDTNHGTIPEHMHFHLVPSKYNIRELIAKTHDVDERKNVSYEVMKEMTEEIRKPWKE
jgi:diadenosine tetraphosphate (Ap4A) HIT family hydrolase